MRLIDADEFESYLINRYGGNDTGDDIIEDLHNQPTAYSVEVARCKDCKHWNTAVESDKAENGLCYGFKFSLFVTPKDGFCFKGERRDP